MASEEKVVVSPEEAWGKFFEAQDDPAAKPPAEKEPEPEPEPVTEPEPEPDLPPNALAGLEEQIAATNAKLTQMLEKGVEKKVEAGDGRSLTELVEELMGESPAMGKLAELVVKQNQMLEQLTTAQHERAVTAELGGLDREVETAAKEFGLKPGEVAKVLGYLAEDETRSATLTFEEGARRVIPQLDSRRGQKPPAPNGSKESRPAARIVSEVAAGGKAPEPFKPGKGENFEDISRHVLANHFNIRD